MLWFLCPAKTALACYRDYCLLTLAINLKNILGKLYVNEVPTKKPSPLPR